MPRSGHGYHGYQVGGRDSVGAFLHPTNGYRGALAKRGVRPKNHVKENFAALKSKQAENRAKKEAMEAASSGGKKQYKLARFRNISGRAMSEAAAVGKENAANLGTGSQGGHVFMRKGQGRRASAAAPSPPNMKQKQSAWSPGALPPPQTYVPESRRNLSGRNKKPPVPRAQDAAPRPTKSSADFVAANNKMAAEMKPQISPTKSAQGVARPPQRHKHHAFGRVPNYLQNRKQKWAEEEEQRRIEAGDPNCPPGMRMMPEAERLETLQALKKSEAEGKRQLMQLPLRVETASQQKKKAELEGKMKEIEEAIVIFSREKVFINKD